MRPHPRIRKTVKWGGAVVCVLLAVVWVGSGWYVASLGRIWRYSGEVNAGALFLYESRSPALPPGTPFYPYRRTWVGGSPIAPHLVWTFESKQFVVGGRTVRFFNQTRIPLWAPFSFLFVATVVAWRMDTLARCRAKLGACLKCSYCRTGLAVDAVCPECGAAAPGV